MRSYASNDEFFQALTKLIERMRQSSHGAAADKLQSGYAALNGLTDGWAILLASLEEVVASDGPQLPGEQASELHSLLSAVKKAVYR